MRGDKSRRLCGDQKEENLRLMVSYRGMNSDEAIGI